MADESANRRLKIEAHDASRVEWSMYIPLPRDREISEAEVSFRLEFPENVYVPHDGWEQLQILARLSSPDAESAAPEPLTVDGVRRSALGVALRRAPRARAEARDAPRRRRRGGALAFPRPRAQAKEAFPGSALPRARE